MDENTSDAVFIDEMTYYFIDTTRNNVIVTKYSDNFYTFDDIVFYYDKINCDLNLHFDRKKNWIINTKDNLIFIPLFNTYKIIIDYTYSELSNYSTLEKHAFNMHISSSGKKYVKATKTSDAEYMHVIIYGRKAAKGCKIDHINSNGLDNRSSNIRELSNSGNAANRIKADDSTSRYMGVDLLKNGKWRSQISFENKKCNMGMYEKEIDAAKMRDRYAVHFHKEGASLNRDENGEFLLSKEEINDIIQKGLSKEFLPKEKQKILPKNLYCRGTSYYYRLDDDNAQYTKTFSTLEEAEIGLNLLKEELENKKSIAKKEIEKNIKLKNGIPIIEAKDKDGIIVGEIMVDEKIWKLLIHCNWNLNDDGYATGVYNGVKKALHIHVYNIYYGDVPDGYTVNHINRIKHDCRVANIEKATMSEQLQNRDLPKKSCLPYVGVVLEKTTFRTQYKGKRIGTYKYLEDAAKKYNELALKDSPNAKINKIITVDTTVASLFDKKNITIDFIKNIETLMEMRAIFWANPDWKLKSQVLLGDMKKVDLEKYREKALKCIE